MKKFLLALLLPFYLLAQNQDYSRIRNGPGISVVAYGALGTGTLAGTGANDSSAINSAMSSGNSEIFFPALKTSTPTYYNIGTTTINVPATVTSIHMAPNVCLVYSGTGKAMSFATRQSGTYSVCVIRNKQDWNTNNGGSGTDVTSTGIYLDAQRDATFHIRSYNFWTGVDSYALSSDSSGVKLYPEQVEDSKIGINLRALAGTYGNNQNLIIGGRVKINSENCSGGTTYFAGTYGVILGGASQSNNSNKVIGTNLEGECVQKAISNYGSFNTFDGTRHEANPTPAITHETGSNFNIFNYTYGSQSCETLVEDNGTNNSCTSAQEIKLGGSASQYSASNLCIGEKCGALTNRVNTSTNTEKSFTFLNGTVFGPFSGSGFRVQAIANTPLCQGDYGNFALAGFNCYSLGVFGFGSSPTISSALDTAITRKAAGLLAVGDGQTVGAVNADLIKRFEVDTIATVASSGTIAPSTRISFVTGTTAIATITAPTNLTGTGTGGCIILIPDPATGPFTTTTAGNIALASTGVVNKALHLCYLATTSKWYPSY